MILSALTDQSDITQAYQIVEHVLRGGQHMKVNLGWQGGGEEDLEITWHAGHDLWVCTRPIENRYWCAYGVGEPGPSSNMSIVCEINFPFRGINRRVAGVFGRDEGGELFIFHSGKVGGGRPGIGKETFLKFFHTSRLATLDWPDGRQTKQILISRIGDADLLSRLAEFVHLVKTFKEGAVAPADPDL